MLARSSSSSVTAQNLLFGVLALQNDLIHAEALLSAMRAWVQDRARPLAQILVEQGSLGADACPLLERLVQKRLEAHGGDTERTLESVCSVLSIKEELHQIADADLQATLTSLSTATPRPPEGSAKPLVGTLTSTGRRFRVVRPHAQGGLGSVFIAEDEELHREVALKQIHDEHAHNQESRARFLLEAEVTGRLEHPGIVPVYGLGTHADGRPFYVMRFIRGNSLKEAIDDFHRAEETIRDPGTRTLAVRELLGRFLAACNAIAYAHNRGVLHRDLKPSNIMLGPYGETLVVDWGLAKLTGEAWADQIDSLEAGRAWSRENHEPNTGGEALETAVWPLRAHAAGDRELTEMGKAIGTPAYMSPEQAAGRLDLMGPASDVYSLGGTLYCLLTGKPPVEDADPGVVLAKVQQGDIVPPRVLKPSIPPPLQAICLKAMALKPNERYPSPQALADDLELWLADEPVSAYTAPWSARLNRWVRRHRALVAAFSVAGLLLAATASLGLFFWNSANQRQRRQAYEHRLDLLRSAEASEELAVGEIQAGRFQDAHLLLQATARRVAAEPALAPLHDRLQARELRAECLASFYRHAQKAERLMTHDLDQDGVAELEAALAAVAVWDHEDWWQHLPTQDLTAAEVRELERDVHLQLLLLAGARARESLMDWGNLAAARKGYRAALQAAEAAQRFVPTHGGRLVEHFCRVGLGEPANPRDLQHSPPSAWADYYTMGLVNFWVAWLPQDPISQFVLTRMLQVANLDMKNPLGTAEHYLRMASSLDPRHYWTYYWLGETLNAAHKYDAAELAYGVCVALQPEYMDGYYKRALVIWHQRQSTDSPARTQELYRRALADVNAAIKAEPDSGVPYLVRCKLRTDVGELDQALADCNQAIQLGPESKGLDPHFYTGYAFRADIHYQKADYGRAIADYSEAIRLFPRQINGARFNMSHLYNERGNAYHRSRQYDLAVADYSEAIRWKGEAVHFSNRAASRLAKKEFPLALQDCAQALKIRPGFSEAYQVRGATYLELGQLDKARADLNRALEVDNQYVAAWSRLAEVYGQEAQTLLRAGQPARAVEQADELSRKPLCAGVALYQCAAIYARAAAAVQDHKPLAMAQAGMAEQYTRQSIALLCRADAAGFFAAPAHFEKLGKDPSFDSVRSSTAFKQWLADREKTSRPTR
jgi:serine/threonine protein kinase/predicted Zn-dependent protease